MFPLYPDLITTIINYRDPTFAKLLFRNTFVTTFRSITRSLRTLTCPIDGFSSRLSAPHPLQLSLAHKVIVTSLYMYAKSINNLHECLCEWACWINAQQNAGLHSQYLTNIHCLGWVCLVLHTNKHDLRWFQDHYRLNTEWAFVVVKCDREYYNNDENSNVFNTSQY